MDDDLTFSFTNPAYAKLYPENQTSPLEAFENLLKKYEPAVGIPFFCMIKNKKTSICYTPKISHLHEVLPVTIQFDAACNAFHRNAIKHLLPYNLMYDNVTWFNSQKFVISAADLIFRGQVLHILPITTLNTKHRKYPRKRYDNWNLIYNLVGNNLPKKYLPLKKWFPTERLVFFTPKVINDTVYTPYMKVKIPKNRINVEPYKRYNT